MSGPPPALWVCLGQSTCGQSSGQATDAQRVKSRPKKKASQTTALLFVGESIHH